MKRMLLPLILLPAFCLFCGCSDSNSEEPDNSYLRLTSNEKLVNNSNGSFTVTVLSNTDWNIEPQDSWLKPERTSGSGEIQVRIAFEENPEPDKERSGVVRFYADGLNPIYLTVKQTDLTFTNPIGGIPDPWWVKRGDFYYICKADGGGINVSVSDKMTTFPTTQRVWNAPQDGSTLVWNRSNIWAPELHFIDGRWYIYYTAGRPTSESNGSYTLQRSGVLRALTDDPKGAWEDLGMLYTGDNYTEGIVATAANTEYAIDLSVFELNGKMYAVWSGNPSKTNGDQHLYIASMSNPYTISSSRVEISRPDKSWETVAGKVNEGPAFLKNKEKGKFFVIYSCNGAWTKHYRLGSLELSDTTANPLVATNWKKSERQIFYRCDDTANVDGVNGVGHCSFVKSLDETEDWIVYHVKNRNDNTWSSGRSTFMQKFTWNDDGTPKFGDPVGWGESIELPSGETL